MADVRAPDFNDLLDDNLVEILLQLDQTVSSPAALARLRMVNTRFDKIIGDESYWKKKVAIHFHDTYKRHLKDKDVNWLKLFKEEYKTRYKDLTVQQKKIVSAIKEANLDVIKRLNPTFADLLVEIEQDGLPYPIVLCTKNRNILRHLYGQVILPAYRNANWSTWIDRAESKRRTILFWAICCQLDIKHIRDLFILNRADIDETYFTTKMTPLHLAAQRGRVDVIDLLISEYGFDINKLSKNGQTALHEAARHGKTEAIRYLITKHINLDIAAPDTALVYAAAYGHNNTLKLLLAKGASTIITRDSDSFLAIHYAAYNGHLDCLKTLIEHDKNLLNILNNQNGSPLYFAAMAGHEDVVAYLLEQGADISLAINANGGKHKNKTAIMRAVDNKHWNIVMMLLAAGSDINALIDYFFLTDNHEALDKLISLKPDHFNQAYINSLLSRAAIGGKPQITACLLSHHADATQPDNDGYLPIHLAAMHGQHECVKKLIEHDASQVEAHYQQAASAVNKKTAVFFAQDANDIASVDYLLSKMSDKQLFDALVYALRNNALRVAEKIIKLKPTLLTHRDAQHKTPLMIAVEINNQAAIDLCFKQNEFEEAYAGVFLDMESYNRMNDSIADLNKTLKKNYVQDLPLMLETQELLTLINSATTQPEVKFAALEAYQNNHHTISTAKFAFCIAAFAAIALSVILACLFMPVGFGIAGGITAIGFLGICTPALAAGIIADVALCFSNNFFTRTFQQYQVENHADKVVECARKLLS